MQSKISFLHLKYVWDVKVHFIHTCIVHFIRMKVVYMYIYDDDDDDCIEILAPYTIIQNIAYIPFDKC